MIKKALFFFSFFAFLNCSNSEDVNNCSESLPLNYPTDLNNPALINVLVPGGFVELNGGSKGILLGNVNGRDFIAYDKICPVGDCKDPMTFERGVVLKCACSAANRVSTARGERERIFSCSWQRAQSGVARRATGFRVRRARSPAGASRTPRGERRCTPLVDTDTIARDDGGSLPRNHARRQHAKQQEDGQTCAEAYTEACADASAHARAQVCAKNWHKCVHTRRRAMSSMCAN